MLPRARGDARPRFSTALARLGEVGIWEILYEWTDAPERMLEVALDQARG